MNAKRMLLKTTMAGALLPIAAGAQARPTRNGPAASAFPNAALQTHQGKTIHFYDDAVRGNRVVVFNMMYTGCMNICPPNTANLMQVQRLLGERMGRDVFFYSLTLQPEIDRPPALQAYARRYGLAPGWTLLTGERRDIDAIRRKLGFFDPDPAVDADLAQHTGMVRIGNEALDRWSMMPSLLSPAKLARSIAELAG
ncbi:SCO family protein [Massilia suwonensis]|uniref:SCO family protein n=1 Tax=Massilia suwonensis TaxID=648895 RepID=A0ABW0MFP3_9BURK